MILFIGKQENSLLKAADLLAYALSQGVRGEIITQGDNLFVCLDCALDELLAA